MASPESGVPRIRLSSEISRFFFEHLLHAMLGHEDIGDLGDVVRIGRLRAPSQASGADQRAIALDEGWQTADK
jgi:hypothetical protein